MSTLNVCEGGGVDLPGPHSFSSHSGIPEDQEPQCPCVWEDACPLHLRTNLVLPCTLSALLVDPVIAGCLASPETAPRYTERILVTICHGPPAKL